MLPDGANLDWLRKQAKRLLRELRTTSPSAKLADVQRLLARQNGFPSWRALKAYVEHPTLEDQLFKAAQHGHAEKAAELLRRGVDPNIRESGDNTCPMHWAAAAGNLEIVRMLADAGGDVVGHGDDHELEIIGWATCWEGGDDDAHRQVVEFLLSRGARHHIFSAIALNLVSEVRRIVEQDAAQLSRRMSRNENKQTPLQFAVRMRRPKMVELLLALGADPLGVDGGGQPVATYAASPEIDAPVMQRILGLTRAELQSADRGRRPARGSMMDLLAAVSLQDWQTAERLLKDNPGIQDSGALHLASKRGDLRALRWLLEHGANPNVRWAHWDADVTPLHLAALGDHAEMVRPLLEAGADPTIKDSKHDSDALGWAEFFSRTEIVRLLRS